MFKQKRDPAPDKPKLEPVDAVQQARTRARQRLIGAIVLLAIGIIGFPLVFETQPRPIPVDVPIEIPRREALPPLAVPPARPAPQRSSQGTAETAPAAAPVIAAPTASTPTGASTRSSASAARGADAVITESSADAGRDVSAPRAAAPERAASRTIAQAAPPAEAPKRAASPTPPPAAASASTRTAAATAASAPRSTAEAERARALLEGRPVASADEQRFLVQVGAFADAEAARETRKKVEKLGLKTYTQVAQTPSGSRIRVRVGPFASRGEAEAALAKTKAAGLAAVLLTL
jgi:DedD protein